MRFRNLVFLGVLGSALVLGGMRTAEEKTPEQIQKELAEKEQKSKAKIKAAYKKAAKEYTKRTEASLKKAAIILEEILVSEKQYAEKDPYVLSLLSLIYAHFSYRSWHFGVKDATSIKKAKDLAEKAYSIRKNTTTQRAMGNVYLILGDRRKAKQFLQESMKGKKKSAETLYYLASASNGSFTDPGSEAGKTIREALKVDPKFLWALEDMVMDYLYKKNPEKAAEYLQKLEAAHGSHPDLPFYKGLVALHSGDKEKAKKEFKEYTKLNPDSDLSGRLLPFIQD